MSSCLRRFGCRRKNRGKNGNAAEWSFLIAVKGCKMADGKHNDDIAKEFGITDNTMVTRKRQKKLLEGKTEIRNLI
jgi:hypothetical protein